MQVTRRFVRTSALNIAYEQTRSDSGSPILLLHGFPYDVREYDGVRDQIAGGDWRIIVPCLRGFGVRRAIEDVLDWPECALASPSEGVRA
jgi:pimeloyl-ACP methyl ester carboxylesterase